MSKLTVLLAALALTLLAPAAAYAATATIADPTGDHDTTDLTQLAIAWDGTTLTVAATLADPAPFASLRVLVSDAISLRDETRCAAPAAAMASLTLAATPTLGRLTVSGGGTYEAVPAVSGGTFAYAFSSPQLTADLAADPDVPDVFACASGAVDGDTFFGAFDGKLLEITQASAEAALAAELTRRFGASFTGAPRPWVRCPRQQIEPETRERYASVTCRFEFRLGGGRYRGGAAELVLRGGVLELDGFGTARYTKRVRECRIASTREGFRDRIFLSGRSLRASATFGRRCGVLLDRGGLVRQIEAAAVRRFPGALPRRMAVAFRGDTAGFGEDARFPCRVRRSGSSYAVACANRLGDRFTYRFTIGQKPKPRPTPAPPSGGGGGGGGCDPNYSGACLSPSASDYDCAGGSGDGPLYVQGPVYVVGDDHYGLDSDGDGVACES